MKQIVLALLPLGIILLVSELLWRGKIISGERGRKFVHILSGVYMAFWPLFLPLDGIAILGLMAFVFLTYSRISPIFHAMHVTDRKTYGELFFALAITVCAIFARQPWIYTTAVLFLAIADGGAALAGKLWGKSNTYFVFGFKNLKKSIAGTLAYVMLAYLCLLVGLQYSDGQQIPNYIYLLPFIAACVENISPYGSDDFVAPLVVVFVLNSVI